MKPSIPKWFTYLFLGLAMIIPAVQMARWLGFLSAKPDKEHLAVQYRTCGLQDLPERLRPSQTNKFAVVVAGDGVRDSTLATTRPYSSNYAQGWDLYEGVAQAATKPLFTDISSFVDLIYVDDGGDSLCSKLISEEIIKSPRVIAVIGHATTGTTKVALENYKKANIPTIIPIATNPDLILNCQSCFRLPSNDAVQAKVLADYAVNVLKGRNIYLVWDETDSAREYSEFLQSEVVKLLGSKIKFKQPIAFRPMNYEHLLKSISYNKIDVLIFCGYGSMAREFLNGLRFEYLEKEPKLTKPIVILSDGARISDIDEVSSVFEFEAYLSFPSGKLGTKDQFKGFKPETPPGEQEDMKLEESYEPFGYDALALFSLAFKRMISKGEISRQQLNAFLAVDNPPGSDLCYTYKFEKGENVNSRYFVYSVGSDSVERAYESDYLSTVFTGKPVPALIARYEDTKRVDSKFMNTVMSELKMDANAEVLIIVSHPGQAAEATERSRRLLRYFLADDKLEASRFSVVLQSGPKKRVEIWLVPKGAPYPMPLDKHTMSGGELLKLRTY